MRRLERADLILHGGDFVARSVLDDLREIGPVEAVYGNMDDAELRAVLDKEKVVEADRVRIGLVHDAGPAAGREARLVARFPACDAVLYGHTHVPQVTEHQGVLILNPGSPTERRRAPAHTMLELEIEDGAVEAKLIPLAG